MDTANQLGVLFSMLLMNLPTVTVCLVAVAVILAKWRQAPAGSLWALLGFGLALVLCVGMPVGHSLLQRWVFQSGAVEGRTWVFSAFAIAGSVLQAVIYALLLVAVYAGRARSNTVVPTSR